MGSLAWNWYDKAAFDAPSGYFGNTLELAEQRLKRATAEIKVWKAQKVT